MASQLPSANARTAVDTRLRAMAIFAHPDDVEFICSGTIARLAASGYRIQYVLATSGDKGSDDPTATPESLIATREAEQREAATILGVEVVTFLRRRDGELEVSIPFRRELAQIIRTGRPDIVLTFDPWQRYQIHPDHRAVGQTALDAVAAARDHMYYPEQLTGGLTEHRVHNVYLFATDNPNYYVDVTDFMEIKIAAARAHTSQVKGESTLEWIRARTRASGLEIGVEHAEAFHYLPMARPPALKRLPEW
ncbi:MAG TPA: PIG-L deacetylase family protein [Ktedonobacterales bacterium]